MLMVSIAPTRYSHDLIKESGVFAVNVLTADQVDLGKRFGYKSGRQVDKFTGLPYVTAKTGAPILPQAYAYFDLKLVDTFPAGDHTLFVGEVVAAKIQHPQAKPLIFRKEDFFEAPRRAYPDIPQSRNPGSIGRGVEKRAKYATPSPLLISTLRPGI